VPAIERLLLSIPRINNLDRLLVQSGLEIDPWPSCWDVAAIRSDCLRYAFLCHLAARFSTRGPRLSLLLLPLLYVRCERRQTLRRMEQQLPDTLDLIGARCVPGTRLPSALQLAGIRKWQIPSPRSSHHHDE